VELKSTVNAPFALALQKLALESGTNMDEQDGIQISFQSTIVGEFCATLLVEVRFLRRANWFPSCSSMFVFPLPYPFLFNKLRPNQASAEQPACLDHRFCYSFLMSSVEEIEAAIGSLPQDEFFRLHRWVQKRFDDAWDRKIAEDAQSGRLAELAKTAVAEHRAGQSTPFPSNGE
jgi:hypothetical protein